MNTRKHIVAALMLVVAVAAAVLVGCKKEVANDQQSPPNDNGEESAGWVKLNNPYSVDNMQQALDNLLSEQKDGGGIISPSHYYICFKPKSEEDLDLLKYDSTLCLFLYPMDYELKEGYERPPYQLSLEGVPESLYASVPVEHSLPMVDYEIIENLFIPEEINGKGLPANISVEDLVKEAFRITNNLEEDVFPRGRWTPAGTIMTWDKTFNRLVPLVHAKVRATYWFTTRSGITDSNGHYICDGDLGGKASYELSFERYDFEIRDGWLSTATIDGPKKTGDWNYEIREDEHAFWATIFRAASHYYFEDIKGLRRPPQNSFWHTQLKIRAHNEDGEGLNGYHCPACRFLGLGSAVHIYSPQHSTPDIYGTVIHELAHASHWNMSSGGAYTNSEDIVAESWARGVQWELTGMKYSGYTPRYFGVYTGVVQDMIDGINGYDQVTEYTIRQLEDALLGKKTWNEWKNNIKNKYDNATENYLDGLFNHWLP